jgi:hypothetical protein
MDRIEYVARRYRRVVDGGELWKLNRVPFWLWLEQLLRASVQLPCTIKYHLYIPELIAPSARRSCACPSYRSSRSSGWYPAAASQSHPWFRHGFASSPFDVVGVAEYVAARSVREETLTRHDLGRADCDAVRGRRNLRWRTGQRRGESFNRDPRPALSRNQRRRFCSLAMLPELIGIPKWPINLGDSTCRSSRLT